MLRSDAKVPGFSVFPLFEGPRTATDRLIFSLDLLMYDCYPGLGFCGEDYSKIILLAVKKAIAKCCLPHTERNT